jgi:hypothetical protein
MRSSEIEKTGLTKLVGLICWPYLLSAAEGDGPVPKSRRLLTAVRATRAAG